MRAGDYAATRLPARARGDDTSEPPRKVSKQLFMICAEDPRGRRTACAPIRPLPRRVFEVHPEVAFWRLNGERALGEPKKVKSRAYEPGLALRRRLLIAGGTAGTRR